MTFAEKFPYTVEYQLDLLRFTVTNRLGYKALELYQPDYFSLLDHHIIAEALKSFYKKKRRVPGKTLLIENLTQIFKTPDYIQSLLEDDRKRILGIVRDLYHYPSDDPDEVMISCSKFAAYVELRNTLETINLTDFNSYDGFANKVVRAVNIGNKKNEEDGTFLIKDIRERQLKRQDDNPVVPTPFYQINSSTNAGGYIRGGVIVVLDMPKKWKTGMMINLCRGYLKMKKRIFYADLENGQDELSIRLEQSITRKTKKEILSGEYDKDVQRILRKYKRLGGEVVFKRFPAYSTTAHIEAEMERAKRDFNMDFEILMIDYPVLMNSLSNKADDFNRISDVYLDISNLALKRGIEHVWCAGHVIKIADKREATRYEENDIAKCIDIVRHVQAIWGLNRSQEEIDNGIMRMELVAQRDGPPDRRAFFTTHIEHQRVDELSRGALKVLREEMEHKKDTDE